MIVKKGVQFYWNRLEQQGIHMQFALTNLLKN